MVWFINAVCCGCFVLFIFYRAAFTVAHRIVWVCGSCTGSRFCGLRSWLHTRTTTQFSHTLHSPRTSRASARSPRRARSPLALLTRFLFFLRTRILRACAHKRNTSRCGAHCCAAIIARCCAAHAAARSLSHYALCHSALFQVFMVALPRFFSRSRFTFAFGLRSLLWLLLPCMVRSFECLKLRYGCLRTVLPHRLTHVWFTFTLVCSLLVCYASSRLPPFAFRFTTRTPHTPRLPHVYLRC